MLLSRTTMSDSMIRKAHPYISNEIKGLFLLLLLPRSCAMPRQLPSDAFYSLKNNMYMSSNHVCVYLNLLRKSLTSAMCELSKTSEAFFDVHRSPEVLFSLYSGFRVCACVYSTFAEYSFRRRRLALSLFYHSI